MQFRLLTVLMFALVTLFVVKIMEIYDRRLNFGDSLFISPARAEDHKEEEKKDEKKDEAKKEEKKEEAKPETQAAAPEAAKAEAVEEKKKGPAKQPKRTEPHKPAECAACAKHLPKKLWYYRNGAFYCTKKCFTRKSEEDRKKAAEAKAQ